MPLLAILAASAMFADLPAIRAYDVAIARQCPAKHLEWLNPGIVADPLEDFVTTLPRRQQVAVQREVTRRCAHVEAGASCGDVAVIETAHRLNLVHRLAAQVCRADYACTAPFTCQVVKPR